MLSFLVLLGTNLLVIGSLCLLFSPFLDEDFGTLSWYLRREGKLCLVASLFCFLVVVPFAISEWMS